MTCPEQHAIGPYTLGTLDPGERARVAAHLEDCADCKAVRDEFAGLPGLMARLTLAEAASGPATPGEPAFQRLRTATAEQRRRRVQWLVAAAAALLLIAGSGAAVALWPRSEATQTVTATSGSVHARATVTPTTTGSRVSLHLTGVPAGQRCRLVAVSRDGHRDFAGSWEATYAGAASIAGNTAARPEELSSLVVETFDGQQLVRMPLQG